MADFEGVMWRMEADPRLRPPVAAVEILDRIPDWLRFLEALRKRSGATVSFRPNAVASSAAR